MASAARPAGSAPENSMPFSGRPSRALLGAHTPAGLAGAQSNAYTAA
jgi:hypothetical protein